MTDEQHAIEVERIATSCRDAGQTIEINRGLPYVAVKRGEDDEYFFQEHEAQALLDDCPDYLDPEDYILCIAQGW